MPTEDQAFRFFFLIFLFLLKDMDPVEDIAFVMHSLAVLFTGRVRNDPSELLK